MYIGKFNGKPCRTSPDSPNQSVCITGLSGTGKTTRINYMELDCANGGETVLVLDVNKTHTDERIFPKIRQNYMEKMNRIDAVKDGLGLQLFTPMISPQGKEETFVQLVSSVVRALSSSQGMGARQIGVLREAVIQTIQNIHRLQTEADAFAEVLCKEKNPIAKAIYQRFWPVLNCGALRPSTKKIQPAKINIIDFSGMDTATQVMLAEIVLSYTWRKVQFGDSGQKTGNLVIVLDEFQNLSLKKEGALRNMLREGRKFGVSFILATQSLEVFTKEVLSVINQTATRLYFCPAQNEGLKTAKEIDAENPKEYLKKLKNMQRGESIAVGDLCIGGTVIRRPLLLR